MTTLSIPHPGHPQAPCPPTDDCAPAPLSDGPVDGPRAGLSTRLASIPRRYLILTVLGAVAFMAQLDFFVVNVALNGIGRSFPGSSDAGLSWVLSAYAIVFAAVLVPAGRLADRYGRKRTLQAGVALFTATSAAAALAPNLDVLIGARAIQAVGAAMIVPTSLGLLYPSFPKSQHTRVVGIWAGVAGVAALSGPPVGGLLVGIDWRLIFLINIPIGIVTILAGWRVLPEVRESTGRRAPELLSIGTLLGAITLLVLGISEGSSWGWGSPRTILVLAFAVILTGAALQRTLRAAAPVIEPELFRNRVFTASTIGAFGFFVGFAIFLLGSALFMERVWHFSAVEAGIAIIPAPVLGTILSLNTGRIAERFGRTLPAVTGVLVMSAAGVYWLLSVGTVPNYWVELFPGLVLMGVAGGLSQPPLFAAASTLDPDRAATGSAVLQMSRQVGTAIGVAILVALTTAAVGVAGYQDAWIVQIAAGLLAAVALIVVSRERHAAGR